MFPTNKDDQFSSLVEKIKFQALLERVNKIEDKLESKDSNKSKDIATTKQQLLILHYLGVLDSLDLDTKNKAKLLSPILNRNWENIRQYLTYINSPKFKDAGIKTKENLETILPFIEKSGIDKAIERIKSDIEKIEFE